MTKLKVLDLFSGIGGFSLGLERTQGFETITFCEIDSYCQKVLNKHWPHVYIHSDIRTLGAKHFEHYPKPDLICGGFPCQDISKAGRGKGLTGQRSGMWFEMLRIIGELNPRWILVENVSNLRTKGADEVLAGLEAEGYANRDRLWDIDRETSSFSSSYKSEDGISGKNGSLVLADANGIGHVHRELKFDSAEADNDAQRDSSASCRTLWPARIGHEQYDWECSRLIESRLDRTIDGLSGRVDRLKTLGNSVVPQIPELFGHAILQLDKQFKEAK